MRTRRERGSSGRERGAGRGVHRPPRGRTGATKQARSHTGPWSAGFAAREGPPREIGPAFPLRFHPLVAMLLLPRHETRPGSLGGEPAGHHCASAPASDWLPSPGRRAGRGGRGTQKRRPPATATPQPPSPPPPPLSSHSALPPRTPARRGACRSPRRSTSRTFHGLALTNRPCAPARPATSGLFPGKPRQTHLLPARIAPRLRIAPPGAEGQSVRMRRSRGLRASFESLTDSGRDAHALAKIQVLSLQEPQTPPGPAGSWRA